MIAMEQILNFRTKNIAITDIETTGLDPLKHEIIEIGLVLIKQPGFEIIDTLDIKVKPENINQAAPEALELNGYKPEDWLDAVSLQEAMSKYLEKVVNAVFCAYNVSFDFPFLRQACVKTGLQMTLDYHSIDLPSLVWARYRKAGLDSLKLKKVAEFMGLQPEPEVHGAINGAMLNLELLKKLVA